MKAGSTNGVIVSSEWFPGGVNIVDVSVIEAGKGSTKTNSRKDKDDKIMEVSDLPRFDVIPLCGSHFVLRFGYTKSLFLELNLRKPKRFYTTRDV